MPSVHEGKYLEKAPKLTEPGLPDCSHSGSCLCSSGQLRMMHVLANQTFRKWAEGSNDAKLRQWHKLS